MRIAVWVRRPFSAFVRWWIRSDSAGEACDRAGERELRWWGSTGLCGEATEAGQRTGVAECVKPVKPAGCQTGKSHLGSAIK
jgi:hypothetical protein